MPWLLDNVMLSAGQCFIRWIALSTFQTTLDPNFFLYRYNIYLKLKLLSLSDSHLMRIQCQVDLTFLLFMISPLIVKYFLITLCTRVNSLKIHAHSMLFILSVHYSNLLTSQLTYPSHLKHFLQAVKLRQSIYGEEHPITKRTLDLFTVIYAEMGKEQYTGTGKSKLMDNTYVFMDQCSALHCTLLCRLLGWSMQHCSV